MALKRNHQKASWILVIALLLMTGIVAVTAKLIERQRQNVMGSEAAANDFVSVQNGKFYLAGDEYKFVGFNLFDAAGSGNSPYSCPQTNGWFPKMTDDELSVSLRTMKANAGASVLRFWAFQKYTKGGTDFSGIDKVIALAKQYGFKVIPVLENGPGDCTEPGGGGNGKKAKWQYNSDTWFTDGYKVVNTGNTLSYRDYVQKFVSRYKEEPTIFGWMMMNEADTSKKVNGKSALYNFAQDIGTLIKSIDRNHIITVGTQSNGASGATGQDFLDVYGLSVIDFAEGHDWAYWGGDTLAMPGATVNTNGTITLPNPTSPDCLKTYQAKIACSFTQAVQMLHKPFLMGEAGIAATDAAGRERRADLMDAKMKAFFDNGGSGYLYWQWNKIVDSEHLDVLGTNNDPLLPVMKRYSSEPVTGSTPVVTATSKPTASPTAKPTLSPTETPNTTQTPTVTVKPTATPTVTAKPTVAPTTTAKPTSSPVQTPTNTVKPTATPTPIAGSGRSIEAEAMLVPTAKHVISTIDNVSALTILSNGSAFATVNGSIQQLILTVKAQTCLGYPHINVKLDGQYVLDTNISQTSFSNYQTSNLAARNFGSGNHTIEVIYNNDASFIGICDRNVILDKIVAQ